MYQGARTECSYNSQKEVNTPLITTGVTTRALTTLQQQKKKKIITVRKVTRHSIPCNVNTTSSFVTFRYVQVLGVSQKQTICCGLNACGRDCTEISKRAA